MKKTTEIEKIQTSGLENYVLSCYMIISNLMIKSGFKIEDVNRVLTNKKLRNTINKSLENILNSSIIILKEESI